MKKITIKTTALFCGLAISILFGGCQKEQNASANESKSGSEPTVINGISSNGQQFEGTISSSYADALLNNFKKEYRNKNQSYQIAFNAKELSDFILMLQTKDKSDVIYVNFGLYGNGAPAPNQKDEGRMTVFFTGNNNVRSSGYTQSNGSPSNQDGADYLNHGQLYP